MRSSLTMLGIIIGVGAVIAVIGIGQGAAAKAQEQLAALGSNMLFVGSGSVNRYGLTRGQRPNQDTGHSRRQGYCSRVPIRF